MKMIKLLLLFLLLAGISFQANADEKERIPKDEKWERTNERDTSSPQLYQSDSSVYVYSEKQLDNVTIGITDIQGNVYYQEISNIPAGKYYAISIESLLAGQYYLCIYQGSNYVIGTFIK